MITHSHAKVLRLAAANKLPRRVDVASGLSTEIIKECVDRGFLSAISISASESGQCVLEPRITVRGKELLRKIETRHPAYRAKALVTKCAFSGTMWTGVLLMGSLIHQMPQL